MNASFRSFKIYSPTLGIVHAAYNIVCMYIHTWCSCHQTRARFISLGGGSCFYSWKIQFIKSSKLIVRKRIVMLIVQKYMILNDKRYQEWFMIWIVKVFKCLISAGMRRIAHVWCLPDNVVNGFPLINLGHPLERKDVCIRIQVLVNYSRYSCYPLSSSCEPPLQHPGSGQTLCSTASFALSSLNCLSSATYVYTQRVGALCFLPERCAAS